MSIRGQRGGRGGQGGRARGGRQQANKEHHQKATAQKAPPATTSTTLGAAKPVSAQQQEHTLVVIHPVVIGKRELPIALASSSSSSLSALDSSISTITESTEVVLVSTANVIESAVTKEATEASVGEDYDEEEVVQNGMNEDQEEQEIGEDETAYEDLEDEGIGILDDKGGENQVLWRSDSITISSEVENFGERLLEIKDSFVEILQETSGNDPIEKVRILGLTGLKNNCETDVGDYVSEHQQPHKTTVDDDLHHGVGIEVEMTINTDEQSRSMISVEEAVVLSAMDTVVPTSTTTSHSSKIIQVPSGQQTSPSTDPFKYKGSTFGMKISETSSISSDSMYKLPLKRPLNSWCLSGGVPNFSKLGQTFPPEFELSPVTKKLKETNEKEQEITTRLEKYLHGASASYYKTMETSLSNTDTGSVDHIDKKISSEKEKSKKFEELLFRALIS